MVLILSSIIVLLGIAFSGTSWGEGRNSSLPLMIYAPASVKQGEVMIVTLRSARSLRKVGGDFLGRSLRFYPYEDEFRSIVGIDIYDRIGEHNLVVEVKDVDGWRFKIIKKIKVIKSSYGHITINFSQSKKLLLSHIGRAKERKLIDDTVNSSVPVKLWRGAFIIPARGRETLGFGVYIKTGPNGWTHKGIDIGNVVGTPIKADNDGLVVLSEKLAVRGKVVIIDHGQGVLSLYFHLSELKVKKGQAVKKDEIIGLMGSTGLATGPHLHWEIRAGGISVDPKDVIEKLKY